MENCTTQISKLEETAIRLHKVKHIDKKKTKTPNTV